MNYNDLLKQAQTHYDAVKDAADVEPAIMMAGFAAKVLAERDAEIADRIEDVMYVARSTGEFVVALRSLIRELKADPAESGE